MARGSDSTLRGNAVLLLCSSCCQGITHYLYLQLKTDMQLCLDIYMQSFLFLLVLELTVWIMLYYYKKLSLADKVFTQSLTACISGSGTTGSSQLEELKKPWRDEKHTAKHRAKLLVLCFLWSDSLHLIWLCADFVNNEEKQIACLGFGKFLASPLLLNLFAAGHFTPWPISNQGWREGIEDINRA